MQERMKILYEQLKSEIHLNQSLTPECLKKNLLEVSKFLSKLQNAVAEIPFQTVEQEIDFFKCVKPKFYQWKIYYVEIYAMECLRPVCGRPLVKFYREQLDFFQGFLDRNAQYYQYYRLKLEEMDRNYFVRDVQSSVILATEVPDLHLEFGTAMDYLFAKFMAYEKLLGYVSKAIDQLSGTAAMAKDAKPLAPSLKWTGDKTNLVEVIYGLFYTGQLNNGNAKVADIIKWMEHHLDIDLSRSYKNFIDIKNRKRDSPTKFLDKMKSFILQRIDEDNTYRPNRGIALRGKLDE